MPQDRSVAKIRRIEDYKAMQQFQSDVVVWKALDVDPDEEPSPCYYRFHYNLKSIIGWNGGKPSYHMGFDVNLDLNPPYPTSKARAWFVGLVPWHPNIHPDGRVCYEDRWLPGIGIELDQICKIIGMMIAFQLYGRCRPVRTDPAFWVQFDQNRHLFPTDPSPILKGGNLPPRPDDSVIIRFG